MFDADNLGFSIRSKLARGGLQGKVKPYAHPRSVRPLLGGRLFYALPRPDAALFFKAQILRRRNIDQLHYMSYLLAVDDSWEHGKT
jgi:hypothetical protein